MQKRAFLLVGAAAIAATPIATRAAVYSANADAEIREAQPEFTRGFGPAAASGQAAELQLSQIESNRNLALVRFSIDPSWNSSNLGYASMRIYLRISSNFGSPGGSVRLYALDPDHPLNTTWNEQNVFYRDAGTHQQVNTNPGSGQSLTTPSVVSQPTPAAMGNPELNDPPAPVAGVAGYGASSTHAQRAPGILYENAPFSQQVETENQQRFAYNQAQRAGFLSEGPYEAYLPYVNQPAYSVRQAAPAVPVPNAISTGDGDPFTTGDGYTNVWSDIPESNRPWDSGPTNSWLDDIDPAVWNLMGYTRLTGAVPTPTVAAPQYVTIGDIGGFDSTPTADELQINANLVAFLGAWRDAGYTDFTFLVGRGTNTLDFNGDTVPDDIVQGSAVQFASKDLIPAGGLAGDWAPQLLLAPEPGSATLAILGLAGTLGFRRRMR